MTEVTESTAGIGAGVGAGVGQPRVDHIVEAIGPRLRELRTQQGLSLQQLAERSGVSAAAIHKIERSGMVPTITTLLKLADAFDRPVAYFVDEEADQAGPVAFTSGAARPELFSAQPGVEARAISGSYTRFFLDGRVTTVAPGASSGPSLTERQGEELVLVLQGALRFEVDGRLHEVGTGDSIHLRTDRPHRWENAGKTAAQAVWVALKPL